MSWLDTPAGRVPRIISTLTASDHVGAWKARWGINRMNFIVPAGLYAIGSPTPDDPVVVTANYKMTFDVVREVLVGRNVWLLVLETYGVNVWCAAGKGSFGTDEVVKRVRLTELAKVVRHRRLLLPILGAPGVAAHEVARRTGFSVSYATLRADDLPAYLDNGMVTTEKMRQLTFTLYERMVLVPVELLLVMKQLLAAGALLFAIFLLAGGLKAGILAFIAFFGAVVSGTALTPLLLPLLPGRSFCVKGACAGLLWSLCLYLAAGTGLMWGAKAALFLGVPAVSAFYALNFTGCTNYTSLSGVKKEMRIGIPIMGSAVLAGIVLLLVARFA